MSDPGQILRSEVQRNWAQLGSIARLCQFHSFNNPSYDAESGNVTEDLNITFPVKGVWGSIQPSWYHDSRDDDDPVLQRDKTFLVPGLDMQAVPRVGDELTDNLSIRWRVKGVKEDPASATYKMWMRPIDG